LNAFGYYPSLFIDFLNKVILDLMKNSKAGAWKKIMLVLTCFAVISTIPSSFADELIETITETITDVVTDPAPVEDLPVEEIPAEVKPTAEPQPSPSPIPTDLGKTEPDPKASPTSSAQPSPSNSPSPSPSPTPPHAITNQSMRIIAPSEVNVDPRARSVFLPNIYVASGGNLLICASSNLGYFDAKVANYSAFSETDKSSSLEISGAYSPYLRISGLGSQAAAIINNGNGLRVFSPNRALAGSYVQLRFVALSEVSNNPKLCSDGSASNTRTIYLRGLGIDLNITKGGITLK
jgi:hypothetical protein